MTANSQEFSELFELLGALRDGFITEQQHARLDRLLASDHKMQQYYVDYILLCSELRRHYGTSKSDETSDFKTALTFVSTSEQPLIKALEQDERKEAERAAEEAAKQAEARKEAIRQFAEEALAEFKEQERRRQEELAYKEQLARRRQLVFSIGSIVAMLVIVACVWLIRPKPPAPSSPVPTTPVLPPVVATITRSLDAQWSRDDFSTWVGTRLTASPLYLKCGLVQIVFDGGAEVILQAPCAMRLENGGRMFLQSGTISVEVPKRALGFTVETPTGTVTDYGTEFGMVVRQNGETEAHVYKGKVALANSTESGHPFATRMLRKGQAATIDKGGRIAKQTFDANLIVRRITDQPGYGIPGKRINLADIVGGGNGFQTGLLGTAIDVMTTKLLETPYNSSGRNINGRLTQSIKDFTYRTLPHFHYIDGVFLPVSTKGFIQVTSEGHRFAMRSVPRNVEYLRYIGNWAIPAQHRNADHVGAILNGIAYGSLDKPAIMMKRNKGITFDLNAIRADLPNTKIDRFTALCGISETDRAPYKQAKADFYVLVDGKTRFHSPALTPFTNAVPIDLELSETDRFLTLMTTYSSAVDNHTVFAVPALELVVTKQNTNEKETMDSNTAF
ncbi:MAG: NPCBM/NEW2 domain-containing protein [Sedimentisphaerales bacterium]|nr:NPCBM/NEW2 domain-containing protein [Sedimentisphaerales bacterium]